MSAARPRPDPASSLRHLAARFFEVLRADALRPHEREQVRAWLGDRLAQPFFAQPAVDQRHGYEAGRAVFAGGSEVGDLVVAAALHDIGKRHSGLGLAGRVAASILIRLRLPLTGRLAAYRDHGVVAARELEELGAPPVAILFARHHHDSRPDGIDTGTWQILVDADQPAKPRGDAGVGISSSPT